MPGRDHRHFVHKAEVLQLVDVLFCLGIRADDGAALKGVEHLGGVKTEHRQVAMIEDAAAVALHAKGMGGVVDHLEVVLVGNFLDGLHITWVSIDMNRHDGRGLGRNRCLDL